MWTQHADDATLFIRRGKVGDLSWLGADVLLDSSSGPDISPVASVLAGLQEAPMRLARRTRMLGTGNLVFRRPLLSGFLGLKSRDAGVNGNDASGVCCRAGRLGAESGDLMGESELANRM